jgi:predicted MFS family arabinose efflux permease
MTQVLQFVQGHSPLATGLVMAPLSVSWSSCAPFSPRLCARWGDRTVIAGGLLLAAAALLGLAFVAVDTHVGLSVLAMLVLGAGMGTVSTPITRLIMSALPLEHSGMASATNNVTRQIGAALGVAVLGALLAERYRAAMAGYGRPEAMDNLGEALRRAPDLAGPAKAAFLQGFGLVNLTCAGLAAALAALAWVWLRRPSAK